MKLESHFSFVLMILILVCELQSNIEISGNYQNIEITGNFAEPKFNYLSIEDKQYTKIIMEQCKNSGVVGNPILPVYSQLVALPRSGNLNIEFQSIQTDEINLDNPIVLNGLEDDPKLNYPDFYNWYPQQFYQISEPVIMRGKRFCQLSIFPIQVNTTLQKIRVIRSIDLNFKIDYSKIENSCTSDFKPSSTSFNRIISRNIVGYDRDDQTELLSSYLFIIPDDYAFILEPLLNWKRKLGFDTNVAPLSETGYLNDEIKEYIQNAYDNWDIPPEYVVLVGDVTGSISIPSYYVDGTLTQYDVSDHPYSLLEGDDYFPDVHIGRISVRDITELLTIINKIISYEQQPYLDQNWITRSIMVSYVMNSSYYPYFSARETKMAVRDKLLNFTHTIVDTCISPYQPGQLQLEEMINSGCSLVNYRGAGNYNYWAGFSGTMFGSENVLNLNNGFMLPFITSITCGGGDFAALENPRCFGEVWMSAGTPGTPKGAIGFIGPSERDTKTPFNNALDMGIYQGITQEGLYRGGEMLLRGKMELYLNYPFGHEWGSSYDSDQFYFYVYNLLGDPGLAIWTDFPKEFQIELANEYLVGSNHLEIILNSDDEDLQDFLISITDSEYLYQTGYTDASGTALIPIQLEEGEYTITASKYGYLPVSILLEVEGSYDLNLLTQEMDPEPVPDQEITLQVAIKNQSQQELSELSAILQEECEYIELETDSILIAYIDPDSVCNLEFDFSTSPIWRNGAIDELMLEVFNSNVNNEFYIAVPNLGPELIVEQLVVCNENGYIIPDESTEINFLLENQGTAASGNFDLLLESQSNLITVIQSGGIYQDIEIGETGSSLQNLEIETSNFFPGETVAFLIKIIKNEITVQEIYYETEIGNIELGTPTFCDYGYCAVESNDFAEFSPPEYNWIELDPEKGGNGILIEPDHQTADGFISTLELPFNFSYFGIFYEKITICSNGWLSLGQVGQVFHRNRNIPSGSGPPAMIAPFWDNLEDGEVFVGYDIELHRIIIEWSDFHCVYDPNYNQCFEAILYDPRYYSTPTGDGQILIQYQQISNLDQEDNYATIGIENLEQTSGLLMSFANLYPPSVHQLSPESAILFTPRSISTIPLLAIDQTEVNLVLGQELIYTHLVNLFNNGNSNIPVNFTIEVNHFSRLDQTNKEVRDLSSDFIFNSSNPYVPYIPNDLFFYLVHLQEDGEAVHGVNLSFPQGVEITEASDLSSLIWNNETGDDIDVSWGFGNGEDISQPGVHPFDVTVIIDGSHNEPLEIVWTIQGDGIGSEPHTICDTLTIIPSTESFIWIEYPNGYEYLVYGTEENLFWQSYGDIEELELYFSSDGGDTYELFASDLENTGIFPFTVPNLQSDNCLFKLISPQSQIFDESDHSFSIGGLNLIYPNSETIIQYNTIDSVLWSDLGGSETIDVQLSTDAGYTWITLGENINNNGFFEYLVPGPASNRCRIKLISADGNIRNQTDYFTISDIPVNWLECNITEGTIIGEEYFPIAIEISTFDLPTGIYQAFLNITSSIGQKLNLPVNLEIIGSSNTPPIHTLYQNYPNPFNPETLIRFKLREDIKVELNIFNLKGQSVKTLINKVMEQGNHQYIWDGTDDNGNKIESGIYFYKLKTGKKETNKKMVFIK